jgi:hypothetical protein
MKLEGLYTSLLDMTPIERMKFFDKFDAVRSYHLDRSHNIRPVRKQKKVSDKVPKRKIAVTPEELAIMKKLGLV